MASRKAKARAKRKAGYAPSLLIGKPEYMGDIKYDGPPVRPYPPKLRELIEIPSKTIVKKPELLPPYTEVSINQTEEAIDLEELRSYGRYVVLSYDGDFKVKALISNNITSPVEVENPRYYQTLAMNQTIEKANKSAQERYDADVARYEKAIAEYNTKHGTEVMKDAEPVAHSISKQVAVRASDISGGWDAWTTYDASSKEEAAPAGYSRWDRAPKYSGLNIGDRVVGLEKARDIPLEAAADEEE